MSTLQHLDQTPRKWQLFGLLTMLAAFRSVIWGMPFPFRWGDFWFWIVPPVGVWIGLPANPWFWPVVIVMSPLFLYAGLYAGYVWWGIFRVEGEP